MLRKTLSVLAVTAATAALVTASAQSASATTSYPGAGFVVRGLTGMTNTLTVPTVTCTKNENSAVVLGLMGTSVGTSDGWNAAAVLGCAAGHPWYRIQAWVNALGGGHAVADAKPGDVIQCRIIGANTHSPQLQAWNETTNVYAKYRLKVSATTAVTGAYAGAFVPTFTSPMMQSQANHKPLSKMDRTRHVEARNGNILIGESYLYANGMQHKVLWRHH